MSLSAVIFDLNGTIVADENVYGKAFKKVLEDLGATVKSDYPHEGGIGVEENWPKLLEKYGVDADETVEELSVLTQKEYVKNIDIIKLKPGLKNFLESLRKEGYQTAVATSNSWNILDRIMAKFNLGDYFDVVTTSEEVVRKKPDPRIFLLTSRKLEVLPKDCIVFEDSASGVKAAKDAGMRVVGVYRNKQHKETLKDADFLIKDFKKLNIESIA